MTTSRLIIGDCLDVMPTLPADSVHAIVTDPPYGLEFMGKEWDKLGDCGKLSHGGPSERDGSSVFGRQRVAYSASGNVRCLGCGKWKWGHRLGDAGGGGLGCACDKPEWPNAKAHQARIMQKWHHRWATEALRVAKPGAFLLAFGGTRTFHRLTCALEDAGWEIRDCVMWLYGSGFPKSHDVSKAIDKAAGAEREVVGKKAVGLGNNRKAQGWNYDGTTEGLPVTAPATDAAKQWDGWGTALKPAWEPIIVARKPLDGTVAHNVLKHGCGGLNVDGCRVKIDDNPPQMGKILHTTRGPKSTVTLPATDMPFYNPQGRWPANVVHDGSDEVVGEFPAGSYNKAGTFGKSSDNTIGPTGLKPGADVFGYGDSGSAARFFYCAKASRSERNAGCEGLGKKANAGSYRFREDGSLDGKPTSPKQNFHPTVKPLALMEWLVKLVAPPGGTVLDPFMGSGTTGIACGMLGHDFIGIEKDPQYVEIAKARVREHCGLLVNQESEAR